MKQYVLWMLGVVAAFAAPVWAHHSFAAQYDVNQPVILRGTVTKFELIMPHSWVRMDGTDDKGKAGMWAVEFGNPNQLFRGGWTKNTMKVGMEITVKGSRSRDGSNRVHGTQVQLSDGTVLLNQGAPREVAPQ